MQIRNKR